MNKYAISRGQLIVLWIITAIVEFLSFSLIQYDENVSDWVGFLFFTLPFLMLFYALGWHNSNKKR